MADTLSGWKRLHTKFKSGNLAVFHEKITRGTTVSDSLSSEINFLPPGVDFSVTMKPSAALSSGADLALYACPIAGGTHALLKDDVISITTGTGYAYGFLNVDPANTNSIAQFPVYKLFIDGDATNIKNFDLYVQFIIP